MTVSENKPDRVYAIVGHQGCHAEERYAIKLMREHGEKKYPGTSTACLTFWTKLPEGWDWKYAAQRGYQLIGLGYSPFDEHLPPGSGIERQDDTCAAMLVAKDIGCDQDPVIQEMLKRLYQGDKELLKSRFELGGVIKNLNVSHGDFKTQAWAEMIFHAIHQRGVEFFGDIDPEVGTLWNTIVGVWLLTKFATRYSPDVAQAGPRFLNDGVPDELIAKISPDGKTWGRESFAWFIAYCLGLEEDLALAELLRFTAKRHGKVGQSQLELHSLTGTLLVTGHTIEEIWRWASTALDAIYAQGLAFAEHAGTDFAKATVVEVFAARTLRGQRATPQRIKLVAAKSDSPEFAKYARSQGKCAVVIQQNNAGNVQIQTEQKRGIDLAEVIQVLRAEESRIQQRRAPSDPGILTSTGTVLHCEEWYFPEHQSAIFNGTLTKSAPPTKLPLERISELVQIGLDATKFEPMRAKSCQNGRCLSNTAHPCPWYHLQLHRCRLIRFNARAHQKHYRTVARSDR